ncbi:dockerin type I domain-containing protein [Planctomycetaceae bacterium SH139]
MRNDSSQSSRRRRLRMEMLEGRQLLSAIPLGAMPMDTAEFMLGTVAVTPVLLESNGLVDSNTENWTAEEIDQVLANVAEGMQWWVDTLATFDTNHALEFIIDDSFATTPVETPFEPISRRSDSYVQYVGRFLTDQGYDGDSVTLEEAMRSFNHSQREKLDTNWSFTIFVVDSSADQDGMFDSAGTFRQAFAFAGGLFMVVPSGRPASTYAHETGHMFWARDEYPGSGSYNDQRGYYNTQNTNAIDDSPPGFVQQPSIMASGTLLQQAYANNVSAASSLAQVGWQDTDGDGVFDVLDVPLDLDVAALYLEDTQTLRVFGTATAVPMLNANSSGLQNDITLNRVSRLEYRADDGPWMTIASPDAQTVNLDVTAQVPAFFGSLELRAVDAATGIVSNSVMVDRQRPTAGGGGSVDAFAFVDDNENGEWDQNEFLLPGLVATISNPAGIFFGRLEPDDTPGTIYDPAQSGLRIEAVGNQVNGQVASFAGDAATGTNNFQFNTLFSSFGQDWTAIKQQLKITFDQPTTDVSLQAIGLDEQSYGRLEAFDQQGNLIARYTSGPISEGQVEQLSVHDPAGQIASILAYGTNGSSVALDDLRFGPPITATSATFGTFEFTGLPAGTYQLQLDTNSSQYEVIEPTRTIEVSAAATTPLVVATRRLTSPWTNPDDPFDVNDNGVVQPIDALIIINELNRGGARELDDSVSPPPYLDVTGDRRVTPLDALRVINFLNRTPAPGGGGGTVGGGGAVGGEGEFGGPHDPGPAGFGPAGFGLQPGDGGFAAGDGLAGEGEALDDWQNTQGRPQNAIQVQHPTPGGGPQFGPLAESTERARAEAVDSLLAQSVEFSLVLDEVVLNGPPLNG